MSLSLENVSDASAHLVEHTAIPEILYEDADILVVNKPAGILVHPVGGHYDDTLSNMVAAYFREKGEHVVIRPIGRLDKDTSGAVLFAKNKIAAAWFSAERTTAENLTAAHVFASGSTTANYGSYSDETSDSGSAPLKGFEKEYLALVHGTFPVGQQTGEIHTPLSQCPGRPLKMQPDPLNGKEAHTFYEVKTSYPPNAASYSAVSASLCTDASSLPSSTLLNIKITTGRTHQIRVHMASIGHPLLGDFLYGTAPNPGDVFQRAALHAAALSFTHPFTHKQLKITAPLPEDFRNFLL